ncbi:MAG: hypothetical protein PHD61_04410 [Bacteroidales bacterium]|nr:hypothetical protein [Lentimicrobiaceae bacterium]MDD5694532.1 hypothetical protein [Bacteroidales bacterium]
MKALKTIENINKFKEDQKMRTLVSIFIVVLALFITSCSTSFYSTTPVYDDAYYTAKSVPVATETVVVTDYTDNPSYTEEIYGEGEFINEDDVYEMYEPVYDESYSYTDPEGQTYVTNNYYGDYYDYSYASRIRRFGYPYYDSYYSSYYTSPWYYDPWYWNSGLSFSIGFGWGWGSFGMGWGYPYYSWGYPNYGWYDPWWGYPYYGYNNYWYGYNDGYYDGYWNGYYDGSGYYYGGGYYPDYASVYYGPRNSHEGSNIPGDGRRSDAVISDHKSDDLSKRMATDTKTATTPTRQAQEKSTIDLTRPSGDQRSAVNAGDEPAKRTSQQNPVNAKPTDTRTSTNTGSSRSSSTQPKTYSSPVYTRPKTSQEYKAPSSGTVRSSTQQGTKQNTYSTPSTVTPRSSNPSQQRSVQPAPAPSRSSTTRTYSAPAPTRSYSTPSRSGSRSYSTPSRSSSPSYSAPSRSGSSGGSSSSHSGGGSSSGSSRSGGSSGGSGGRR